MFSARVSGDLRPNRLAQAIERMRGGGRAFVDLTGSNPTRAGFTYPADLLAPLAAPDALAYSPEPLGSLAAREAVAADYARRGLDVDAARLVLTASTSEAYSLLFKLLCDPGDEVLIPRPSYPLFEHLTRLDEVQPRAYDIAFDGGWAIDLGSLERAAGARTRAVLLVSPNNPTGSIVAADELARIAAFCAPRGIAIVADEVFADYDLDPGPRCQRARFVDQRGGLVFSLGGLSKTAGLPQIKLGWIALAGGAADVDDALARLELICDTYLSVSTPVQVACAPLLARGAAVREQIQARVAANYRRAIEMTRGTPCSVLPAGGGWYGVLSVPSLEPEEDLVVRLLEERAVLAHPGFFYDFARESYLIVGLLAPEAVFADGIARILRHFDCKA